MTMIFAHRGFSGYYPENTMLAFHKAAETACTGIELDVQLSKDGQLVIMHDETLDRTTNGSGYLKDHTLKELKALKVGVNFPNAPEQTIPTLEEYFEFICTTDKITNIELKTGLFEYEDIEDKLVKMVKDFKLEKQIWFSSFNHYTLARIQEIYPAAVCGLLMDTWLIDVAQYAADRRAATVNACSAFCALPGMPASLHAVGVGVQAWTPNEPEIMQKLIANEVDSLITNYPDKAAILLGRSK
ncbi:MAG: glycerophosphodiester phosphodiesterase [Acidaminococcaceae bacterium]|nr:glycerophosphodiester phosphodiesterase [Acidaminococcaceae bacterium]